MTNLGCIVEKCTYISFYYFVLKTFRKHILFCCKSLTKSKWTYKKKSSNFCSSTQHVPKFFKEGNILFFAIYLSKKYKSNNRSYFSVVKTTNVTSMHFQVHLEKWSRSNCIAQHVKIDLNEKSIRLQGFPWIIWVQALKINFPAWK